jgi:hypothetical protein
MQFDHIQGPKLLNICQWHKRVGLPGLMRELLKCELVCISCHEVRTSTRHWIRKFTTAGDPEQSLIARERMDSLKKKNHKAYSSGLRTIEDAP